MNKYFCVLPFYSYENSIGSTENIYCCRLRPGTNIESVRDSIKNKQCAPECQTCWSLESAGLNSERQIHNQTLDYYLDRDLEKIEQDAINIGFQTKIVKLTTSNLCNGTCVTCGSALSSAWAQLENKHIVYQTEQFEHLDFSSIAQLGFVGGEPLLEKTNFKILENLLAAGNTDCFISIVTNGSVNLKQHQIDLLKQFKNLNICLSIDGVGPIFEYMRYPLKWPTLLTNIEVFKSITNNISVSAMISNLNILYLTELLDFFHSNNLNYLCKQIEYPVMFSPGNLPANVKQTIIDKNSKYKQQVVGFLNCGVLYTDAMFNNLRNEVVRQDALKNIRIVDFMPEIAVYLNLE